MIARGSSENVAVDRPALVPWLKGVSALFAALVLFQAFMGGRGWFLDYDLIKIHGYIGDGVLLVAIIQLVLMFSIGLPSDIRRTALTLGSVLVVLTIVQLGLGYSSKDDANAAAWHIPNGVLIFGLTVFTTTVVFRLNDRPR
jgi:hypothetical protein